MWWMRGFCALYHLFFLDADSLKLTLREVVFLNLLRPRGWEMVCGWSRSIRGSWKVTHLVVFLMPPGEGEEGTLRGSIWNCAAGFGTLRSLAYLM